MLKKESGVATIPLLIAIVAIVAIIFYFMSPKLSVQTTETPAKEITNFEECVAAGNPVQESYPAGCVANGKGFRQDIGNELEKTDLIMIASPRPNETVSSPLEISGEARGTWYFEAEFTVRLYDSAGNEIALGIARAEGDWMTEEFVPFNATLTFSEVASGKGTLVLEKSNPSGLPEHDDELIVPLKLQTL